MPNRQVTIYNKIKAITAQCMPYWWKIWGIEKENFEKEIWRVEIRAGKKELKKWNLRTFDHFEKIIGNILEKILIDYKYTESNKNDSNSTRWQLSPIWKLIIKEIKKDLFSYYSKTNEKIILNQIKEITMERFEKQLIGTMTTFTALHGNTKYSTLFISTNKSIERWDSTYIEKISNEIILDADTKNIPEASFYRYSEENIREIELFCTGWALFFSDVSWVIEVKNCLEKASKYFDIGRGERRGWDDLFYPPENNIIESDYIKPVLKTMKNVTGYIAKPDATAFCCSENIADLEKNGMSGTVSWINKFKTVTNGNNIPLPEVLGGTNLHWYEMKPDTLADIVMGLNPDNRIFAAKMKTKGFINQRLIRFSLVDENSDIDLYHALLNSILGLFMIESSGFGRGLGVLDLNPTNFKKGLFMLNPNILSAQSALEIKALFSKITKRNVLNIKEEISSPDRILFDQFVLKSFGIDQYYKKIKQSLLELYEIRKSVEH